MRNRELHENRLVFWAIVATAVLGVAALKHGKTLGEDQYGRILTRIENDPACASAFADAVGDYNTMQDELRKVNDR
jgi:hypothetical protein